MPDFSIKRKDRIRLQHMLDGAMEIQQYAQSSVREDLDVIWSTSTEDIPSLITELKKVLE